MMTPCSVGTHAPGSLSETGSSPARKKSPSNFPSNNGSHFASAMRKGAAEFTRFEHEGWERVADKYDSVCSSLTRQFILHLIDTVGCRVRAPDTYLRPLRSSGQILPALIFPEKWLRSREASFRKPFFAKAMHNSCHLQKRASIVP